MEYKHIRPLWRVVLYDVICLAAALIVFSLFHHVLPSVEEGIGIESARTVHAQTPTPEPEATDMPDEETPSALSLPEMPVPRDSLLSEPAAGYFGKKFADKFITGDPVYTVKEDGFTYVSENINLTFTTYTQPGLAYHAADFYIRDITNFRTAFAHDLYGKNLTEKTVTIAERCGALLAANGDNYGMRTSGIIIRNGVLYRDHTSPNDLGVLYWDGTFEICSPGEVTSEQLIANGAYQTWDFGPGYLDENGGAKTEFNSRVGAKNPRTVFGYFEPGHYCIVCIDGRVSQSDGASNITTSRIMASLGCKAAYNMDGGQTSVMTWKDQVINVPYHNGRAVTDILMITE